VSDVLALLATLLFGIHPAAAGPQMHVGGPGCNDDRSFEQAQSAATPVCSIPRGLDLAPATGATILVHSGSYPKLDLDNYHRDDMVRVVASPSGGATIAGIQISRTDHLRIEGFRVTSRFDIVQDAHDLQIVGNDIGNQRSGIYMYGWTDPPGEIRDVLIEGNAIHDIDYTGNQGPADGYGIQMTGNVANITIRANTIRSVAEDYIQGAGNTITVDRNTFLGPSLAGSHPDAHADLWQIYGTAQHLRFTNNLVRNTGTSSGILLQFSGPAQPHRDVVIANNVFDHGSDGYEMQLYNTAGLRVINNTVLNSSYGVALRRDDQVPDGSDYLITGNIFSAEPGHAAISSEVDWGTEDFNWIVTPGTGPQRWGRHDLRGGTPAFVNAGAADFRLRPGSRGTGAGDAARATPTDRRGRPRGDAPDLGADQSAALGPTLSGVTLTRDRVGVHSSQPATLRVTIEPALGQARHVTLRARRSGTVSGRLRPGLASGAYVVRVQASSAKGARSQANRSFELR
jgi:hypothetical protein